MKAKVRAVFRVCTILLCASFSPIHAASGSTTGLKVDPRHYQGTWLEIGRRPMAITDGCVAGYTTYTPTAYAREIMVEDGCHEGTPSGRLKSITGRGELIDAGTTNARLKVRYPFFIVFDYRVLYQSPDHSWFISADPQMKNLWIYARAVPSTRQRAVMVKTAKSLGYDVGLLEFPDQR
jgi:apolipoprotein D and lipocalin family protein